MPLVPPLWFPAVQANAQSPSDRAALGLSDDQVRYFVENARDFLYRFGGRLDQHDYELIQELPAKAATWRDQARARLKHEALALCRRAGQYDYLGLAAELDRIGREYTARYSDRVRLELSHFSNTLKTAIGDYIRASDIRIVPAPWALIHSMARKEPTLPRQDMEEFVCKVANERL